MLFATSPLDADLLANLQGGKSRSLWWLCHLYTGSASWDVTVTVIWVPRYGWTSLLPWSHVDRNRVGSNRSDRSPAMAKIPRAPCCYLAAT